MNHSNTPVWNEIEARLRTARHAIRVELRPANRDLELNDWEQAQHPHYFPSVVESAARVFLRSFAEDEKMALLVRLWTDPRQRIRGNANWQQHVSSAARTSLKYRKRRTTERGRWLREMNLKGRRKDFRHEAMFLGIAHRDFQVEPIVSGRLFFISLERPLIFQMYDDRGLFLASSEKEDLPDLGEDLQVLSQENLSAGYFLD